MTTSAPDIHDYWCPKCGMVRQDVIRPICRHGVIDSPTPVVVMADLPSWHPLAKEKKP